MIRLNRVLFVCFLAVTIVSTTPAQDAASSIVLRSSVTITATAIGDRIRITAPSSIVEMHLAVYAADGERLFDQEIKGGNVFDWHLQDGQGKRFAPGAYVCVVTAKSISGKLTQKIGTVNVEEKSVSVQAAESQQLTAAQAQTIGPVEENPSWMIAEPDQPQTPTVIAHDGTDGQMIRGRGALTFRIGNFFTGSDREQMRLTEDGNLGIGTSEPKTTLDVAGTIRAQRYLISKPKAVGKGVSAQDSLTASVTEPDEALLTGSGTQDRIAKWIDNSGTLGDSAITEVGGNVGIGTTTPGSRLVVSANSAATLPPALGIARFADADNVQTAVFADAFGTNPLFNVRRANGTATAPLAVQANQLLGVIGASGYGASAYTGTRARVAFLASENWTNTANGTFLTFNTTANGAATNGGTERLRIDNAGNVGINTTSPAARLHVAGTSNSASTPIAILESSNAQMPLSFRSSGTENARIRANSSGNLFFATLNGNDKDIFFRAGDDAGTDMFIQSSTGNVGIGTTTPNARLDIVDSVSQIRFGNTSADNGGFLVSTSGTEATLSGGAKWNHGWVPTVPNSGASIVSMENGTIKLFTDAPPIPGSFFTPTERMRIAAGRVGIGTTTPTNPFHLDGPGTATGGFGGFTEVVARFRQTTPGSHSGISVDALSGQDPVVYLSENGSAKWSLRSDASDSDRFQIRSHIGGTDLLKFAIETNGEIRIPGGLSISKLDAGTDLTIAGSDSDGTTVTISNEAETSNADVLKLRAHTGGFAPTRTNNFIVFVVPGQSGDVAFGAIQGNDNGGTEYITTGSDYAEWLPRLNPAEKIQKGEIVGLYGGRITKKTQAATQIMAVSNGPAVLGNDPGEQARGAYERIAFIGQVMVRVRGVVKAGDFIVASGLNDGTGVAVSPDSIASEQFAQVVGQAWESSADPAVKSVRTAVGLIQRDPTVSRLVEYSRKQTARIAALEARLTTFETKLQRVGAARGQTASKKGIVSRRRTVGMLR